MISAVCFLKGLAVSLLFGIPAGAIGALAIRRTLADGFPAGFCTGLGSSAADFLYAAAGIFGVRLVANFILRYEGAVTLSGGVFLMAAAVFVLGSPRSAHKKKRAETGGNLPVCFLSAFLIAAANPATFLSFLSAFVIFNIANLADAVSGVFLIAGILCGSALWWFLLSAVAAAFRKRITERLCGTLNTVLRAVLFLLGATAAGKGILMLYRHCFA